MDVLNTKNNELLKDSINSNYIKQKSVYEKYKKIEMNNDLIKFYYQFNHLKNIYRQGWLKVRIGLEHKDKCESIADHSFSVALLALTIIEKNHLNLDTLKCIKMGIVHELGEVYAGDYTPYDDITKITDLAIITNYTGQGEVLLNSNSENQ